MCSGDFKKQGLFPSWCVCSHLCSTTCCLKKTDSATRHVLLIVHGNSIPIGRNATTRATAKPSKGPWFRRLPSEHHLTVKEMKNMVDWNTSVRYFDENLYIVHNHHAFLTQIHSNKFISGVKTFAIARVLTLLNNKLPCICSGSTAMGPYNFNSQSCVR